MNKAETERLAKAVEDLRKAVGKHARFTYDRIFGAVDARGLYDSQGFVAAIKALLVGDS